MIRIAFWLLALVAVAASARAETITAFTHVSVIPMDREAVREDQTVIVRNGRISRVGPSGQVPVPWGARMIDGRGKYLLPGLVDAHAHPRSAGELAAVRQAGITRVLAMGGEPLGWSAAARDWLGGTDLPRIVSSTRPMDGNPPMSRRFYALGTGESASPAIAAERAAGAVLVKTYSKLGVPLLKDVVTAAHAHGMPVAGHTPWDSKAEEVLAGGLDIVAHGEELFQYLGDRPSDAKITQIVALMHANGVALIVNVSGYVSMERQAYELDRILKDSQVALLSGRTYQEWQKRNDSYANRKDLESFRSRMAEGLTTLKRLALAAENGGVLLLAGTDTPSFCFPGECLRTELELLSGSGLSNYQVLRTATANPAKALAPFKAVETDFGTVETGKAADLLLLSANPLADLSALERIEGVMVGGRWAPAAGFKAEQAAMQVEAAKAHRMVDRYEALFTDDRIAELADWLASQPRARFPSLSMGIVMRDAGELGTAGRVADAIQLLNAAEPHVAVAPGLYNLRGELKLRTGDIAGARNDYARSVRMMPGNAQFMDGQRKLAEPGSR